MKSIIVTTFANVFEFINESVGGVAHINLM